jgi:hypothetical protein
MSSFASRLSLLSRGIGVLTIAGGLFACGGGGGGGGSSGMPAPVGSTPSVSPPTTFSANVAALVGLVSAPPLQHVPRADMLLPPNASTVSFPSITQVGMYVFDQDALPAQLKATSLNLSAPDPDQGFFMPFIDVTTAIAGDPSLGQPTGAQFLLPGAGASVHSPSSPAQTTTLGDLPAVEFDSSTVSPSEAIQYVLPFSASINPQGYIYQTLGSYVVAPGDLTITEGYFSTGVPTVTALPSSGTASYSGRLESSLVVASNRDPGTATAAVMVTVNFATQAVTIQTNGMTSVSDNAPPGNIPGANTALEFSGTLTYVPGSNTFSGAVTAAGGMTGNVTGRFYGAGIGSATATQVVGSPPEVGGTFAMVGGGMALFGAFGAK